jgi:cytochrome c oxidase subunit 3
MSTKNHPYHIVDPSPWPISTSFALLFVMLGFVAFMRESIYGIFVLLAGALMLITCVTFWWRDVIKEAMVEKQHTEVVKNGIKIGVTLFIISEVMFFGVFFGSIFKNKLLPNKGLDGFWAEKIVNWVPESFQEFDPWNIPFMNTLILLLSGTTLAWAGHALKKSNKADVLRGLKYTIMLGILFTCFQVFEYIHAPFKLSEGIFTSDFYIATGFHGAHVIVGTIFLTVCYFRAALGHFDNNNSHLAFEFATWYWHFVDVVWILLFVFLYLWH